MATTTNGLRYPTGPDVPDVPFWNQALAQDVDTKLFTFAMVYRSASTVLGGTGNIWLTDLVDGNVKAGNITVGAGGITINVGGVYDVRAWSRQTSSAANTTFQTNIGAGGAIYGTGYGFAAGASQNVTTVANLLFPLPPGTTVQFGYSQATASTITLHGGTIFNGLFVRYLRT